jgi:hypothetical protein
MASLIEPFRDSKIQRLCHSMASYRLTADQCYETAVRTSPSWSRPSIAAYVGKDFQERPRCLLQIIIWNIVAFRAIGFWLRWNQMAANQTASRNTFPSANWLNEKKTRLLFASGNLRFGEHPGMFGSCVETKLKRFPRLNPWCRDRSR